MTFDVPIKMEVLHLTPARHRESSSHKGVFRAKSKGKWKAQIGHNKKAYHLGLFTEEGEAVAAYASQRFIT